MIVYKPHMVREFISQYLSDAPIIVEAGAFMGHDSIKMLQKWPNARIFALEPIPELFEKLKERVAPYPSIVPLLCGLSDCTGTRPLHVAYKPDRPELPTQASSLHEPFKRLEWSPIQFTKTIDIKVMTVPDLMKAYDIGTIDLLWLDLQGHELSVLKSCEAIFSKIKLIHMEVYFDQEYKDHAYYEDVLVWLADNGFEIVGRDFVVPAKVKFGNLIIRYITKFG